MIKKVQVFDRSSIQYIIKKMSLPFSCKHWYLISIYGDDGVLIDNDTSKSLKDLGCTGFLSLDFWDITDVQYNAWKVKWPNDRHTKSAKLFSIEQAKQIVKFLDWAQEDFMDSVLVAHCTAGISRSGAVATFANDYCNLDYKNFLVDNPLLYPNVFGNILLDKKDFIDTLEMMRI